ncbi:hypothetical protein CALCODRAFT_20571 [Calocera cornea HHB12733]|uniref:Uncharacterized protein n=1 Tax=Calocera cornea HHB12733 TaxID=1353952 RepID=A0A165E5U8_9BASI|nr:hypothetical protein CALCODRAFT_20571 [Calocera cornea HHB12733]
MVARGWHMQGVWIPLEDLQEWWAQQPEDEMMYGWNPRNSGEISLGLSKRLKSGFGITMKDPKTQENADYCDIWVYKRPSTQAAYREVFFIRRLLPGLMKPAQTVRESDKRFINKLRHAGFKKMTFAMLEFALDGQREVERD